MKCTWSQLSMSPRVRRESKLARRAVCDCLDERAGSRAGSVQAEPVASPFATSFPDVDPVRFRRSV